MHNVIDWINMGQENRIVEHKKVEEKMENTLIKWTRKAIHPFFSHFFLRNTTLFSERLRVTCTVWLLTCLNWQTHRWQTEVLGRCQLGMCRVRRYLSRFGSRDKFLCLQAQDLSGRGSHRSALLSAQKIIARYEMRTYVWKLQMSGE